MKRVMSRKYVRVVIIVFVVILLCAIPFAGPRLTVLALERLDIVLFYRVRFEVLGQSPKGQYYIKLFDTYTREITQTIINRPSLDIESLNVLIAWQPDLDALVNGHGGDVIITKEQIQEVSAYLDDLSQWASPELKSTINTERSITPLERTAGMTMDQAWVYLNQDPRFPQIPEVSAKANMLPPEQVSIHLANLVLPDYSPYSIDFNPDVWEYSSWNNGVAVSWEFRNRSLPTCVMTIPKLLSDPYSPFKVANKTLGNYYYESRAVVISSMTLYVVYKALNIPVGLENDPNQEPSFIVYPGYEDSAPCISQSEALLSNIHLSSNAH
jgi:hypothetical protein